MWGRNRKRSLFNLSFSISTEHWCSLRALTCMTNIRQTERLLFSWVLQDKALTVSCKTSLRLRSRKPEDTLHPRILAWKMSTGLDSPWTLTLTSGQLTRKIGSSSKKETHHSVLVAPWASKSEGCQHPAVCTSDRMGVPWLGLSATRIPELSRTCWTSTTAKPSLDISLSCSEADFTSRKVCSHIQPHGICDIRSFLAVFPGCTDTQLLTPPQGDVGKGTSYLVPWEWMCFLALVPGILGARRPGNNRRISFAKTLWQLFECYVQIYEHWM